ncbi:DUF2163 domain-containing protein [Thalassobius sp. MITS945101]|uniref:DUF2163 domain-containing protein n=1 Tax=Thalassobius sp. MITS945101 TaxID=3096994 RepID=UPI00399B6D90
MQISDAMLAHLRTGVTTLCRCWEIHRSDGPRQGFTDHDKLINFNSLSFGADTGLSASTLQQATGLSVDNAEAMGGLSAAAISEADIAAGRYDGAKVTCWLVNWAAPEQRAVLFRGTLGQLERSGGAFKAELRGLTDQLNEPMGRSYQAPCGAVLGDADCGVNLNGAGYRTEQPVAEVISASELNFAAFGGFEAGWFSRGRLEVLTGAAVGLRAPVKLDEQIDSGRRITLWEPLRAELLPGDQIALFAGCDKRFATCRLKFNNALNFQGFPDIPSDDWMTAHPASTQRVNGGRRR